MSTAVLQQPISMALRETSFPTPSNKKPAFSNPPAWFAPSYRDIINSTDSSISTISGRSLQNAPSEQSIEKLKIGSSLQELQNQKTHFLSSTSTSIASPSSMFGDLNNNSTVWSTAFSGEPQVRLPLPFSPLLAPVHLSLLLTGMGLHINLFLFTKINGYLYHQRVSPPLKKRPYMLSEGNAAKQSGVAAL
jgi:hypothetical protein